MHLVNGKSHFPLTNTSGKVAFSYHRILAPYRRNLLEAEPSTRLGTILLFEGGHCGDDKSGQGSAFSRFSVAVKTAVYSAARHKERFINTLTGIVKMDVRGKTCYNGNY